MIFYNSAYAYILFSLLILYIAYSIFLILKSSKEDNRGLSKILWILLVFLLPFLGSTVAIAKFKLFDKN